MCHISYHCISFQRDVENIANSRGVTVFEMLATGLAFVAACFIIFPIREEASNAKHLQFVAGAKELIFWLTTFLFDSLIFILICLLATIAVVCFQVDGSRTAADIGRMWIILLYYAWAFLPLIYIVSFIFKVPATGYVVIFFYFYVFGVVASVFIESAFLEESLYNAIHIPFIILSPHYSLRSGFFRMNMFYQHKKTCAEMIEMYISAGFSEDMFESDDDCADYKDSYYKLEGRGIGLNIVGSLISGFVLFALLLLLENHIIGKCSAWLLSKVWRRRPVVDDNEDIDVSDERRRISNMSINELGSSHEVAVKNLTKYYCGLRAVNGLCLGVHQNECFGLLGVNGAGKTSTFRMMTGDTRSTYGQGWVRGYSLNQIRKVHQCIGYCPQFDALNEDMTAQETLIMFALIKGYRYSDAKRLAETFSDNLDFRQHLYKQVRQLSGGNKRKLSVAVAMIGNPPILYLDEPTSGMDPATKYYFRALVRKIRDSGKCIILTSHSLEECEALCTRLTIMASGSFKCLGSVQHLKTKFAKGCTFTIKIRRDANEGSSNSIQKYIKDNLPMAQLSERHEEILTYNITGTEVQWSKVFGVLEAGKRNIKDIEDFSLAQKSLEQVFLSFVKNK
nr:unnamed protein product [Callosobruchus analis]